MDKYNTKISQLAGLFTQTASEIVNDNNLKKGEKFLLLQRLVADIAPATKTYEEVKKEIEDFAKNELLDNGSGKSDEIEFEGASVLVKYSYNKPTLDPLKLSESLKQAYSEIGAEFKEKEFLKEGIVRRTVEVKSILDK